jgi:hypothetical protein
MSTHKELNIELMSANQFRDGSPKLTEIRLSKNLDIKALNINMKVIMIEKAKNNLFFKAIDLIFLNSFLDNCNKSHDFLNSKTIVKCLKIGQLSFGQLTLAHQLDCEQTITRPRRRKSEKENN